MKKHSYEFIKSEFEKEGYKLFSKDYVDVHTSMKLLCPVGHEIYMRWEVFNRGGRCKFCNHDSMRLDIEFIRQSFKKEGYILLTKKYINAYQQLKYICPEGHKHFITWGSWNHGNRCGICASNVKHTIEFIQSEFAKEGYQLSLTTEYINNKQKLKYICSNGHEHGITWSDWKTGYRCPMCRAINMVGEGNHQWKGGITCEPYCDAWADKEYKKSILERDNYQCQNPDCWETDKKLTVHHIDYNKKHCGPENLITLCRSCNGRSNKDREWYTSYYTEIMRRKGYAKK